MRHFAVIGTDTKPVYAFAAIPTVILWREILGWRTIVFVYADLHDVYIKALKAADAHVVVMHSTVAKRFPGRPWISQAVRMTAGQLLDFVQPCDYLVTGDSDMAPVNAGFFRNPPANPNFDLILHGAFHFQTKGKMMYPMCYVGMSASMWRFLLTPFGPRNTSPDGIIDAFAAELDQGEWYLDQRVLYRMVARWNMFFGINREMRTGYHNRRIDRDTIKLARERIAYSGIARVVDLHFMRPAFSPEHWAYYRDELFPMIIPPNRVKAVTDELDGFLREFTKALADTNGEIECRSGPMHAPVNEQSRVYVPPRIV